MSNQTQTQEDLQSEASFKGTGKVKRAPEFATFTLTVKSECYKTLDEAVSANDEKVAFIQSYLQRFIDKSRPNDAVYTDGGSASRFKRVIGYGDKAKTECERTWQKTTEISFSTGDMVNFSRTYNHIQATAYREFGMVDGESGLESDSDDSDSESEKQSTEKGITFATISQAPRAHLTDETLALMDNEAVELAAKDAHRQFMVCSQSGDCGANRWFHRTYIGTEPEAAGSYYVDTLESAAPRAMRSSAPLQASVSFKDIVVSRTITARYKYGTERVWFGSKTNVPVAIHPKKRK